MFAYFDRKIFAVAVLLVFGFTLSWLLIKTVRTNLPTVWQKQNQFSNQPLDQGILNHDTYITHSQDPTKFPGGTLIAESASVPDILLVDNKLMVYFVNALTAHGPEQDNLAVVVSEDNGQTWTERQSIKIEDKPENLAPVDPSLVLLDNGKIRLYFYDFPAGKTGATSPDQAPSGQRVGRVYSALSEDGYNFKLEEGVRLEITGGMTDPEVIYYNNQWLMYYVAHQTADGQQPLIALATSKDGLQFVDQGILSANIQGIPGAIVLPDGKIRLYGCQDAGIPSSISDDGINFNLDIKNILPIMSNRLMCDPALVLFGNEYWLTYKVQ